MQNRKNIAYGAAILVTALAFGAGANRWIEPNVSLAADSQQIFVDNEAAARLAEVDPSQALLADLYDQVAPSVVSIQVTATRSAEILPGFPFGGQEQAPVQGQGSGFIYDNDGHIVTNNHVIADATSITVYFSNGMWADAELVATDPSADLAVLKVTPPDGVTWQPLSLAATNSLRVGYSVLALGSPFGLEETMTVGVVSALGRSLPTDRGLDAGSTYSLPDVIQTDTAINPGNSGGPLLNLNGEVVGVNFAINSTSGSNSGVGFAIPVAVVEKVVPALIADGSFQYAYLGISGATINNTVAEEQNLDDNTLGVYVAEVVQGGPADEAGVKANDVIVAIDDQPVTQFEQMISYLFQATEPGQTVTLRILRDGQESTVDVTLQARPQGEIAQGSDQAEMSVTIAQAFETARDAVREAGLMDNIEGVSAKIATLDGRPVWVVTLTGQNQTATVTIDGQSGEVLELNLD
jgi:serine protease Do